MSYRSSPKLMSCFCPSLRIFKSDFLIQALISLKIVDKNMIPISMAEKSFSFYPIREVSFFTVRGAFGKFSSFVNF